MREPRTAWRFGWISAGTLLTLAAATTAAVRPPLVTRLWGAHRARERVLTVPVRRTDLYGMLTAAGQLESSNNTVIECELETMEGARGQGTAAGGASTILSVVPEGSPVKKGDVLCQIDASDYEEMARQQRIMVEQARADARKGELDLQIARMGVDEFRDGYMVQDLKQIRSQIALAESDLQRARDRLAWSKRMLGKGYVSAGQVSNEEVTVNRSAITLARNKLSLEIYERFTAPREIRSLLSQVSAAQATREYQAARLQQSVKRLETLERQVEHCTIRAPHDGLLVYANDRRRDVRIEPGAAVRQRQKLFMLPDLSRMEVEALIHETVVEQVQVGQRARVTVEGLPDHVVEGHVATVSQLAIHDRRSEVPYYVSIVQLDTIPRGLRPGMTAEVRIETGRRTDVLAIPAEALAVEGGRGVCYVAGEDGLERREVKLGRMTHDLVEVTEGLDEGEDVVIDPAKIKATSGLPRASGAAGGWAGRAVPGGLTAMY